MPHYFVTLEDQSIPESHIIRIKRNTLNYTDAIVSTPGPDGPIFHTGHNHMIVRDEDEAASFVAALLEQYPDCGAQYVQAEGDVTGTI